MDSHERLLRNCLIKKFSPGFSVFLCYDNRNSFDASPIKSTKRKKEITWSSERALKETQQPNSNKAMSSMPAPRGPEK